MARSARLPDALLLTACLAAALVATPILWEHYLILLAAPIALAQPRFGLLWLAPLVLLLEQPAWSRGDPFWIASVLGVGLAILAWCAFAASSARGRPAGTGTRASSIARSHNRPPG